jgi:hypothetical protein
LSLAFLPNSYSYSYNMISYESKKPVEAAGRRRDKQVPI